MDTKEEKVRVDKYLWAVRLFKSRKLATEACLSGKVKMDGVALKPSKIIAIDDHLTVQQGMLKKQIRVKAILKRRVSAKLVSQYMDDLTPDEEYLKQKMAVQSVFYRPKGQGRPTKRERRELDRLKNKW